MMSCPHCKIALYQCPKCGKSVGTMEESGSWDRFNKLLACRDCLKARVEAETRVEMEREAQTITLGKKRYVNKTEELLDKAFPDTYGTKEGRVMQERKERMMAGVRKRGIEVNNMVKVNKEEYLRQAKKASEKLSKYCQLGTAERERVYGGDS